jgi:hypothetical protein
MKTKIVISTGWKVIQKYDFLITMNKGDVVEYKNLEYKVDCCFLDINKDTMCILLDSQ